MSCRPVRKPHCWFSHEVAQFTLCIEFILCACVHMILFGLVPDGLNYNLLNYLLIHFFI